jgi:uncharacterized membrane protein (UPF0127 family)
MATGLGRVIGIAAVLAALGGIAALSVSTPAPGGPRPAPTPPAPGDAPKPDDRHARVSIAGREFNLELALDNETRFKGLSGRTEIPADGGMLFVFPDHLVNIQEFVMRDCLVPIDIIYLDGSGRIQTWYEMKPEPPRSEAERENKPPYPGAPAWAAVNEAYEARLRRYSSRYPAQFVIELKGGTIASMNLQAGQKITLDTTTLKRRAR